MKSLHLLVTLLPLVLSQKLITACKCAHVVCPTEEPAKCLCENKFAISCANLCGTVPQLKFCPAGHLASTNPSPSITSQALASNTSSTPPPTNTLVPGPQPCGTVIESPCPPEESCVDNPATPDRLLSQDFPGICVPPQRCGSRGLTPCAEGRFCVDDPNNPGCSTTFDCPGFCVLLDGNDCAPELGIACPSPHQVCVDDPTDDCFPGGINVCLRKCAFLTGRSSAVFLEE